MPTYDYECTACEHRFEMFQSITAKPIRKCPQCGKMTVRRLIGSGGAIIFKGSGFYQTDYRSSDYTSKAKAEKAGDKVESAAPSKDKSDTKTSAKDKKKGE
ncbi:MAG: zinc ribbon domain-containing protein [Planctomycetes bacterium]|nr:zinc ribbon domain-containing protein [Planctomycetota bacterium]